MQNAYKSWRDHILARYWPIVKIFQLQNDHYERSFHDGFV